MLLTMNQAIKGTALLLEEIQPNSEANTKKKKKDRQKFAFKTLIATILSVRTKDETTLEVVRNLWEEYSTPEELANAPIESLEDLVYSTGFYRQKAKRIKESARIVHEKYNDEVPTAMKDLLDLPGVGRKVANCVLSISFSKPAIAVDTHVHRISNRTGWVDTKKPEKTEKELQEIFPRDKWNLINYTMVSFGKKICKPNNPLCDKCPVQPSCEQLIKKTKKKFRQKNKRKKGKKKN